MADRRPLPLVTADGPRCQEVCTLFVRDGWNIPHCEYHECPPAVWEMDVCHPDEHEAWLREQARKLEVCGRCPCVEFQDA